MRRLISLCALAAILISASDIAWGQQEGNSNEWKESTPESQGMDSTDLGNLLQYIYKYEGMDSLLIVRHGKLILETYNYPYSRDKEHILNSVTKSVVSGLVGIAIDRGYLANDRNTILDWFPEAAKSNRYSMNSPIEVRDLLSMTSGIDWSQYGRDNVSTRMGQSSNWIQFILDRPMAAEPGSRSNYSNGDAHLLSAIIQRSTGEDTLEFASKVLFKPLGIRKPRWDRDPQGINIGSAAMYMAPRDMAKLGQLYLDDGNWNGMPVIPADWVRKSLQRHTGIEISAGVADYGYFWWLYPKFDMAEAWGSAGQRIAVFRNLDLVVVLTGSIPDDAPVTSLSKEIYRRIRKAVKAPSALPENTQASAEVQRWIDQAAQPHEPHGHWRAAVAAGGVALVLGIALLLLRRAWAHSQSSQG